MAKMTVKGPEEYMKKLSVLGKASTDICKKAVKAGADPVADEIRSELTSLPDDKFRLLGKDEKFVGVPEVQKIDLLDSLGVTPVDVDTNGFINAKVGFDGYGSFKTKSYPKGVPNAILARAIESGSSVREKTPFVRTSVKKKKEESVDAMKKSIENDIKSLGL